MSLKTINIPLAGDEWLNLNDLIQSKLAADNKGPISPFGSEVLILSDRSNDSGSRVQIVSDPSIPTPAYELLPEDSQPFAGASNTISLMDKWIKIVDSLDLAITGTATVTIEQT